MKTSFVFGAGADSGIFPLTNHLVAAINTYLTKDPEGKEADRLIKQRLGFHSFSYESIMDNAAYTFIRRNDQGKIEKLAKKTASVQEERLPEKEKAGLDFIREMVRTLVSEPKKSRDKEPASEKKELMELAVKAGLSKTVTVSGKTTVSMFLRQAVRKLLHEYLAEPENKVLHTLFKCIVNLDEILLEYFLGFYNGNKVSMRRYEYLSWTMWAFFVSTEISYHRNRKSQGAKCSIYEKIRGFPAITLNYTTLASMCPSCPELIHFHGSVLDYIDCMTRDEKRIPSFAGIRSLADAENADTIAILKNEILPLIKTSRGKDSPPDSCIIPSMMPPFEIKPIIANDLIDTWHHAFDLMRNSDCIVVIGYSFNHIDSHFNDVILDLAKRKTENGGWEKRIYIINPDVKSIHRYFDGIDFLSGHTWNTAELPGTGLSCHTKANITLIPETTWNLLEKTGNSNSLLFCPENQPPKTSARINLVTVCSDKP